MFGIRHPCALQQANVAVAEGGDRPITIPIPLHRLRGLPIEKGSGEGIYVQFPESLCPLKQILGQS